MRGSQRALRPRAVLRVTLHDARAPIYSLQQRARASLSYTKVHQNRGFRTSKAIWSANAPEASPKKSHSKLYKSADDAVADVQSGSTILSSGFGLCGVAGKSQNSPRSVIMY